MSNEQPQNLSTTQQMERGRCIARLYIAAQHLSQIASTAALDLLETASPLMKLGFDAEMSKSPFPTRGYERGAQRQQLKVMITPPWMNR